LINRQIIKKGGEKRRYQEQGVHSLCMRVETLTPVVVTALRLFSRRGERGREIRVLPIFQ